MTTVHSILTRRQTGVLLHITSLPGKPDQGDLGPEAYRFIDFLADCGVSVWQILPIGPTHSDNSPYQCLSAHAGNPLFIDLDELVKQGWLAASDLLPAAGTIDSNHRRVCLRQAAAAFRKDTRHPLQPAYRKFCREQEFWLSDYALFMALREHHGQTAWQTWPVELRDREADALTRIRRKLATPVSNVKFEQFIFARQWNALRHYATAKNIVLFGDVPIFVSDDSADVWASRKDFDLREDGYPRVVAGVPPDYFSATGQRWGNPHYDWAAMQADDFRWWMGRFRSQLALHDWLRIDHFRGLEAYWEIPAGSETAMEGRWIKAPGEQLLETVFNKLNGADLPLVAENLGIITPEVEALRNRFDLPGMLILQFAFDSDDTNPYLPRNHTENNVVYTGTHDNDTTLSWYQNLDSGLQQHVLNQIGQFLNREVHDMPAALNECALASRSRLAILPLQDILGLGQGYRMNTPGTCSGNWSWRFEWNQVSADTSARLREQIERYGRS